MGRRYPIVLLVVLVVAIALSAVFAVADAGATAAWTCGSASCHTSTNTHPTATHHVGVPCATSREQCNGAVTSRVRHGGVSPHCSGHWDTLVCTRRRLQCLHAMPWWGEPDPDPDAYADRHGHADSDPNAYAHRHGHSDADAES